MKNNKTFPQFLFSFGNLIIFAFLLFFVGIGIIEAEENFWLGISFSAFFVIALGITIFKIYQQWNKLYNQ